MKFWTPEHILLALAIVATSVTVCVLSYFNHGDWIVSIVSALGGVTGIRALLKSSPAAPSLGSIASWQQSNAPAALVPLSASAEEETGPVPAVPVELEGDLMSTQDVSDSFLLALRKVADAVGISGHYLLEVWNSETGVTPDDVTFGQQRYFGPAAVMSQTIAAQGIAPDDFAKLGLEGRLPYLVGFLKAQRSTNHGASPNRPAVLYGINFLPAPMYNAGPNPPDSTLLAPRGGSFWNWNKLFWPYADPAGITVGSMGRRLEHLRQTDARIQDLLHRYSALTGIPYPTPGSAGGLAAGTSVGVLLLALAGAAYAYATGKI